MGSIVVPAILRFSRVTVDNLYQINKSLNRLPHASYVFSWQRQHFGTITEEKKPDATDVPPISEATIVCEYEKTELELIKGQKELIEKQQELIKMMKEHQRKMMKELIKEQKEQKEQKEFIKEQQEHIKMMEEYQERIKIQKQEDRIIKSIRSEEEGYPKNGRPVGKYSAQYYESLSRLDKIGDVLF